LLIAVNPLSVLFGQVVICASRLEVCRDQTPIQRRAHPERAREGPPLHSQRQAVESRVQPAATPGKSTGRIGDQDRGILLAAARNDAQKCRSAIRL